MSFLFIQNEVNYEVTSGQEFTANDLRTQGFAVTDTSGDPDVTRAAYDGAVTAHDATNQVFAEQHGGTSGIMWFHFNAEAVDGVDILLGDTNINTGDAKLKIEIASDIVNVVWKPAGTESGLTQSNPGISGVFNCDVKIDTNAGDCFVFINEQRMFNLENDTLLKSLDLTQITRMRQSGLRGAPTQVIVTDAVSTVGCRVMDINPEAEATYTQSDGVVGNINGIDLSDASYKFYGHGRQSFSMSDPSANIEQEKFEIAAVSIGTVANAEADASHKYLKHFTVSGNKRFSLKDGKQLDADSVGGSLQHTLATNPATGEAWTWADLQALEVGMETAKIADVVLDNQVIVDGSTYGYQNEIGHADLLNTARTVTEVSEVVFETGTDTLFIGFNGTMVDGDKTSIDVTVEDGQGTVKQATLTYTNGKYSGFFEGTSFTNTVGLIYITIGA